MATPFAWLFIPLPAGANSVLNAHKLLPHHQATGSETARPQRASKQLVHLCCKSAMSASSRAPANRCVCKTPSGNPLPRRGQVKESIAKHIAAAAVATASALVCDAGGKKGGAAKPPAAPAGANKKK
nr:uncharacterized protein LOC123497728 [Aegilops tauschii subsp. strangulata]